MKNLIVNNTFTPYRDKLFNLIVEEGKSVDIRYLTLNESSRTWHVATKFKNFKVLFQARNKFTTTSDLIINWINPFYVLGFKKVVLFGYSYTSYLFILFVRSALGKKTYLFNETTLSDKKET